MKRGYLITRITDPITTYLHRGRWPLYQSVTVNNEDFHFRCDITTAISYSDFTEAEKLCEKFLELLPGEVFTIQEVFFIPNKISFSISNKTKP